MNNSLDEGEFQLGSIGLRFHDFQVDLDGLENPEVHACARFGHSLVRLVDQPITLFSLLHQEDRPFNPKPDENPKVNA